MRDNADTLIGIINSVLDFSKLESGRAEVECIDFHPLQLARRVLDLHRPTARRAGLNLELSSTLAPETTLAGDPTKLAQVLGNLVDNALKFSTAGTVRVTLGLLGVPAPGALVELHAEVADQGIGIDPAARARLFRPVTQADSGISRTCGGTGLGLAISRRLVDLMGGAVSVESAPGAGSTFRFHVRCLARAPTAADAPRASHPPTPVPVEHSRVLLADDNELNRQLAAILLLRLGCVVDEAENGAEALALFAQRPYALVLMDCMMPELDGFAATARLRAFEQATGRARTPVLALTASAIEGDRERCLAAGMDDYLAKPFTFEQFEAAVRRWVAGAS
jgi:CheY-like chemotaxis protein